MPRSSSSGRSVDQDSPNHPREQPLGWPMDDLALRWDNTPEIRERLRDGHHLMMAYSPEVGQLVDVLVDKTVDNIKANRAVLSPVFQMMSEHDKQSPCIDRVMEQVSALFTRCKTTYSKHKDRVYQDSWAIKRLCTYAKSQRFRDGPPKETKIGKIT